MELEKTVERIVPKKFKSREEYLLFLRHLFAYEKVSELIGKNSEILEIGFGEGYGAHYLSDQVKSVTGIDVDTASVKYANEKYGSENCEFIEYGGTEIPFAEGSFDAVVSFQVIEHIEEDEAFLEEIQRVLKENSKAYLTTPNRLHRLKPGQDPWNEFHVREYSAIMLEKLMKPVFTSVEIYGLRVKRKCRKLNTGESGEALRPTS